MSAPEKIYLRLIEGAWGAEYAPAMYVIRASVDDAEYIRADVHQAEVDALHAERDRLTALMEKPKLLEAHDLTEPGWYWHKWPLQKEWKIVKVHHIGQAAGQFVGPIKTPEQLTDA